MIKPGIGTKIVLESRKHDHSLHRRWQENVILDQDEHTVVGFNDSTIVQEHNKPLWLTKYPAIFYFDKRYWFNIVLILTNQPFYYCNLSSPFYYNRGMIQYIDYDLDVIVQLNGDYKIVDEEEYKENCLFYGYPKQVQDKISVHLNILIDWIQNNKKFFKQEKREIYYELYEQYE